MVAPPMAGRRLRRCLRRCAPVPAGAAFLHILLQPALELRLHLALELRDYFGQPGRQGGTIWERTVLHKVHVLGFTERVNTVIEPRIKCSDVTLLRKDVSGVVPVDGQLATRNKVRVHYKQRGVLPTPPPNNIHMTLTPSPLVNSRRDEVGTAGWHFVGYMIQQLSSPNRSIQNPFLTISEK